MLYSDLDESQGGPDPETRGLTPIEPVLSGKGYADREDFIAQVRDPTRTRLLGRAIEGRGAFRRFKVTLYDFPELRQAWFAFHDARMQRLALEWLADQGLVDRAAAEAALPGDTELPELSGPSMPSRSLATLRTSCEGYGGRLRRVLSLGRGRAATRIPSRTSICSSSSIESTPRGKNVNGWMRS